MPGFYEIRWLPEGGTKKFPGSRGNYYEFPDGIRLDLESEPVWCRRCEKVTHGERLPSLEEIDQEIRALQDLASESYRMTRYGILNWMDRGAEFVEQQLAELRYRSRWREGRKATAKCIHCGSTEIVELPLGKAVAIPEVKGEILVTCVGMCSTSFNEWFFTPEGDRIPRETRPTYWHHPELDKPENRGKLREWLREKMGRGGGPEE